ncbi:hypothetical protein [Arthrobacter sp. YA7-1]|uniref:hypothetical protein n=1 Tax=Arthrobacter sp. YA7-1 TaxID=2987701 RepID=UPI0029CABBCC|nr:hypothetical protein [Arthrobacter sp. YA7-1]
MAVSEMGKTALIQARRIDRSLTPGVEIGVEELREQLTAVIRWLGSARWGETGSITTDETLPEQS